MDGGIRRALTSSRQSVWELARFYVGAHTPTAGRFG